jgi:translation initiation factor IF-2
MENPTFFHLLAYLYIGFAKLSNNEIPLEEEMAIKRKIAQWMDLSYRNVDQYEMVMRQSLEWFNQQTGDAEQALMEVASEITKIENVDDIILKKVLSEIRDIAVSNGKFDQGEKLLHDKLGAQMGISITTIDDHCEPLKEAPKKKKRSSTKKADTEGAIGFKYGQDKEGESEDESNSDSATDPK